MAMYQQYVYPWREYTGDVVTRQLPGGITKYWAVPPSGLSKGVFPGFSEAADALRAQWMRENGNPRLVAIEDSTGRELSHGDMVTDFRGEATSMFVGITSRGRTGTWKITVRLDHGRSIDMEYNASVYGVTVKEIRDTDDQ